MRKISILGIIGIVAFAIQPLAAYSLSDFFRKPAVIGDSLSQGFFGVTVEKKTQDWAYPVIVSKQANSSLTYNTLKGPFVNLEDFFKGDCGVICLASSIIGGNKTTVSLPTHAGITGATYTSVLRTSGECEDITATKQVKDWYWKNWYTYTYRWITVADCQKPDKFHQFGLRSAGTQMQIMEKVKPSFVFASVGANHVLCTALHTSLDCLDQPRFLRDVREVMRRFSNISTVRGGVIFTVPNVTTIAFVEPYRDPKNRANYTGLKAFFRNSVTSPSQVLDATEVATITTFLRMLNNELRNQAAARNYALTDAEAVFNDIKENGRRIVGPGGYSPGTAGAGWPLAGKPGVFGLDGVHPNRYGHAVLANELIKSINSKYGFAIPKADEYSAWYYDTLNRSPIDLKKWLTDSIIGQAVSWVIGIFA